MTARQDAWADAAERSGGMAGVLFTLLAEPSEAERGHNCRAHGTGFSRDGRRGIKCAIDGTVIRWLDGEQ
jgi:hypothetical protein